MNVMASLRHLTPQDESMILEWRNSDAVAPYMLRDTVISEEEHHKWFGQILADTDSAVFRVLNMRELRAVLRLSALSIRTNCQQTGEDTWPRTYLGDPALARLLCTCR